MSRASQQFLSEDMKPKTIKEIESAAEELYAIRSERIAMNKKEDDAQTTLITVMEKHKQTVYKLGKLIVTIEPGKVKAKVKEAAAPDEDEGGDDDKEADRRAVLTVREAALRQPKVLGLAEWKAFDAMVVGEIVEAHNQSLDWWDKQTDARKALLYAAQLMKPPRKAERTSASL